MTQQVQPAGHMRPGLPNGGISGPASGCQAVGNFRPVLALNAWYASLLALQNASRTTSSGCEDHGVLGLWMATRESARPPHARNPSAGRQGELEKFDGNSGRQGAPVT